ncbi:hypothetical protein FB451DRAFT_1042574 [Mycena latifolia]|nr:hypothetical protein FB451DRAFT_1042574 [Mycena latifolia]
MVRALCVFVVCVLAQVHDCLCVVSNRTIDDFNGDAITGFHPIYEPQDAWNTNGNCTECAVKLDPSLTLNRTWHDSGSSLNPSASVEILFTGKLHFQGTAIYLFCIVPNTIPQIKTPTNVTFTLDGVLIQGGYTHTPDSSSDISYNVSVLAAQGLENEPHTLIVRKASRSLFLFDYAIYTCVICLLP